MKAKIKFLSGVSFNALMGAFLALCIGIAPAFGASASVGASLMLGGFTPKGAVLEGVLVEVWTGELVKQLKQGLSASFLDGLPDYSQYAENDVIHLVDVGGDPDVLVNNSTYPLDIQKLDDGDLVFKLDKFETKATPITDNELHAISYDKMASVKDRHADAILIKKYAKAVHALAPEGNSRKTPVITTTGEADGTRKRLTRADIIELKKSFDKAGVPVSGRRLVLCADHVNDLLLTDQKFAEQYYNYQTGKISNLYGFIVYEYDTCPLFNKNGKKVKFGEAGEEGALQASVAFYEKGVFKAMGSTKMYYSESKNDPLYHRSLVNFLHRFIVLPKRKEAIGAIISGAVG